MIQAWPDLLWRSLSRYFCTVRLLTLTPSFNNSPLMRSAPHTRFSLLICLINSMVSGEMRGSRFSGFDFRRQ